MGIAYRREIDGLRAVAVLAVVLYHAGIGGAGFVGVDVFFVISGYLITSLLLKEQRIDLLAFYARRVRRIFPAAAVVVLATLAAGFVLLSPQQQLHLDQSAAAALAFGANVFFQFTSGGYFDGAANEMPLLHLWSLSVEEQFYLVWPALLMFVPRKWLAPVMLALAVASLGLAEWLIPRGDAAFYEMPARFWELAAGGLVATQPARALPRLALPVGLLVTLVACVVPAGHFPGVGALPAVLGAALILAAVHGGAANPLLASRPMVGVGLISYSLYLWHWPLLALARAVSVGDTSMSLRLSLCVVAVGLACLSYRFVEQPFRRLRFRSGRTVAVGAILSSALALSACAVGLEAKSGVPELPSVACHSSEDDGAAPKCERGSAHVGIWGDSMAYAWTPLVKRMDPQAVSFTRNACSPMGATISTHDRFCPAFARIAEERSRGLDTLVIVARWQIYPADIGPALAAVAPTVREVVILGPTPHMRDGVQRCERWHNEDRCAISRAAFVKEAAPILARLRKAAAPYPNVRVIDVTDHFCTATTCPPVMDGVPMYLDAHHVSSNAARSLRITS